MKISSKSNPLVKHWTQLRIDNGYRREQGSFIIAGRSLVEEISRLPPLKALMLYSGEQAPFGTDVEPTYVSESVMRSITGLVNPDGYAAEVDLPTGISLKPCRRLLACDGVSDPGNMGTLFRTALGFGWNGIFLLPGCCDPYNDKAFRAARGAPLLIPHQNGTWSELLQLAKDGQLTPVIATMDGVSLSSYAAPERLILILGNEGRGAMPPLGNEWQHISIPMSDQVESLNVAIAGSILMYFLR
jgi:TrmH family RNA methyltransferase